MEDSADRVAIETGDASLRYRIIFLRLDVSYEGGTIKWFRHKSVTTYDTGDSGRVVLEVTGIIVKQNLDNSGLLTDSSHAVTTSFDYDQPLEC